jgi:hypothetical protein
MPLYHFSEDPSIKRFVPRPPIAHPETEPLVWAIDEWHAPVYFLPRDCPRACFWPLPTTTPEDHARFWSYTNCRMVIAVEWVWLPRIQTTSLYRYTFPEEAFLGLQDHGVHVSRDTVVPAAVEPMGDLLERLAAANVELRLCPSLVSLAETLIGASLHFSLIRMRNAQGWTGSPGTPAVPAAGQQPPHSRDAGSVNP